MYLARKQKGNETHYSIRESFREDGCWKSRHLFDLGTDPAEYIVYPGGHSYYYHESIEEALAEKGASPGLDDLDTIFWDFLDPEVQRVILGFQRPASRQRRRALREKDILPRTLLTSDGFTFCAAARSIRVGSAGYRRAFSSRSGENPGMKSKRCSPSRSGFCGPMSGPPTSM